jgi:stage V sporulation protein SpoVS
MKALILATGYLHLDGIHVSCVPEFANVTIDEKERTAIKLVIESERLKDISEVSKFQSTAVEPGG